ncbi:unnamed protein product [Heligmosomoides polygyrus]|uniref:MSP domain-containing protein n=1 Tax=Heligmosomoides polygyrus TaxID=6339 RepID=A0A183F3D0_HELPZ|nr:unnamed protein product [Heligmosomoides polygyrus]
MALQPGNGGIRETANNDAVVRVAQTTVLRPDSEKFVRHGRCNMSITHGSCRLLITNPTKRPEVLFKNQAVAVLTPVEVLEDDMQADSFPRERDHEGAVPTEIVLRCPISGAARDVLCSYVKLLLPANPDEAMLPMEVHKISPDEQAWFEDRLRDFDSYTNDRASATATMGKVFNAASSASVSYTTLEDDR